MKQPLAIIFVIPVSYIGVFLTFYWFKPAVSYTHLLSVRQNLDLTGGTFYLESNLAYMRNFGDNSATQLTSVPIRIGYSQSLVGYNPFKWERKIEPLKYERVKKEFLYNVEKVSETATSYFFSLAMAQAEYNLAKENLASTDTLYRCLLYTSRCV